MPFDHGKLESETLHDYLFLPWALTYTARALMPFSHSACPRSWNTCGRLGRTLIFSFAFRMEYALLGRVATSVIRGWCCVFGLHRRAWCWTDLWSWLSLFAHCELRNGIFLRHTFSYVILPLTHILHFVSEVGLVHFFYQRNGFKSSRIVVFLRYEMLTRSKRFRATNSSFNRISWTARGRWSSQTQNSKEIANSKPLIETISSLL